MKKQSNIRSYLVPKANEFKLGDKPMVVISHLLHYLTVDLIS